MIPIFTHFYLMFSQQYALTLASSLKCIVHTVTVPFCSFSFLHFFLFTFRIFCPLFFPFVPPFHFFLPVPVLSSFFLLFLFMSVCLSLLSLSPSLPHTPFSFSLFLLHFPFPLSFPVFLFYFLLFFPFHFSLHL